MIFYEAYIPYVYKFGPKNNTQDTLQWMILVYFIHNKNIINEIKIIILQSNVMPLKNVLTCVKKKGVDCQNINTIKLYTHT